MARAPEAVSDDLEKILATIQGLRAGFAVQGPILATQLGQPTARLIEKVVNQVLDLEETMAVVLKDLEERTGELVKQQAKMADGIRESLRVLT